MNLMKSPYLEVNGIKVKSIWRIKPHENTFNQEHYYRFSPENYNDKIQKILESELPESITSLFGVQTINNYDSHIYGISFVCDHRQVCIYLYGSKNFFLQVSYDLKSDLSIDPKSSYGKRLLNLLGMKLHDSIVTMLMDDHFPQNAPDDLKIPVLPDHHDVNFPHIYIVRQDGFLYPDVEKSTHRWLYGMPYRLLNDEGDKLRVLDFENKCHYFLERPEKFHPDEKYVRFKKSYREPDYFGYATKWAIPSSSKSGDLIKFRIRKRIYQGKLTAEAIKNQKVKFKERCEPHTLYILKKVKEF